VCGLYGNGGVNRIVKREWLHRVKYGTRGKGRHIHLLPECLITNSAGNNYEIILSVHVMAHEIVSAFGRDFL
jgi:hypothetical protein